MTIVEDATEGRGYYADLRFQINAVNAAGEELNLIDGGFSDWTERLLDNRKERYLSSAIGTERLLSSYPRT